MLKFKDYSFVASLSYTPFFPSGMWFSSDGATMIASEYSSAKQFTLSTPYDITTATEAGKTYDFTANGLGSCGNFWMKSDMSKLYMTDDNNDEIYEYTLSTPGDISTATYVGKISGTQATIKSVALNSDGTKMIAGYGRYLVEYTLSTPWAISSASVDDTLDLFDLYIYNGITPFITPDGLGCHLNYSEEITWFLEFGTAWDISTLTLASPMLENALFLWPKEGSVFAIAEESNKQHFYVADNLNDKIHQYSTPTWTSFSGTVQEEGSAVSRTVLAYRRDTKELADETTSDAGDGSFTLSNLASGVEHFLIVLDDDLGDQYNLIGYDKIVGV